MNRPPDGQVKSPITLFSPPQFSHSMISGEGLSSYLFPIPYLLHADLSMSLAGLRSQHSA
ncbi:hypothetical protein LEP1GSC090_1128 [Leptospira borgpetersenii serovar Javanica str. MK146]|nr:hypothetical protein LEP1GSC090_1128 [Leptospira borgpetersenii serovar Javanica str. MK146]